MYASLKDLVDAQQAGTLQPCLVTVDNDAVYCYAGGTPEHRAAVERGVEDPVELFSGSGPEVELVSLLLALGVSADRA